MHIQGNKAIIIMGVQYNFRHQEGVAPAFIIIFITFSLCVYSLLILYMTAYIHKQHPKWGQRNHCICQLSVVVSSCMVDFWNRLSYVCGYLPTVTLYVLYWSDIHMFISNLLLFQGTLYRGSWYSSML